MYFTSDHHFGHFNIISFCKRPFDTTEQMNKALINNWNSTVEENDEVYYLGDFSFCSNGYTVGILNQLKGRKFFVVGNHDKKIIKRFEFCSKFEWVKDYYELTIDDKDASNGNQLVVLSHYPILSWIRSNRGSFMLHGHSHSNMNHLNEGVKRYDVGVDNNLFKPVSYEEIKKILTNNKNVH